MPPRPPARPGNPTVIGIKPDVYLMHVGGSDAQYSLQVTKNYITILGLTDDRRKVVLADNRGNKEGATNNGYIFDVNATGFTMINLTVVQLRQPRLRVSRRPLEKPAQALRRDHPGRGHADAGATSTSIRTSRFSAGWTPPSSAPRVLTSPTSSSRARTTFWAVARSASSTTRRFISPPAEA